MEKLFVTEDYERCWTSMVQQPVGAQVTFVDFVVALKGAPISWSDAEHLLILGPPWLRLPFGQNISKQSLATNFIRHLKSISGALSPPRR